MKATTQLTDRRAKCFYAWSDNGGRFFNTYEEAWKFSETVFFNTGRVVFVEPVFAA